MRFPIYKYVMIEGRRRYKAAVLDRGMPVKDMVLVDGHAEHHPEGGYYIRQGKDNDRRWIPAGGTPQEVMAACLRLANPSKTQVEQTTLHQQAMRFWESYNVGKAEKTQHAMGLVLKNFLLSVNGKVLNVSDVTAQHVAAYWSWEVEHSPTKSYRTAHNRVTTLMAFFKAHELSIKWKIPPFDEEVPEVYEPEEVEAIMAACDQRHRAVYSTMLMALLREKEAVYLSWTDINAKQSTVAVRSKPQWGWRVKKYRERVVKVPRSLIEMIEALPRTGELVFGKSGDPDLHLLRDLKAIAASVRLDPGRCWLHKFRASGATQLLRSGMPLSDVMVMGGWRDIASVQRYLAPMQGDRLEKAVEAAWAAA